MNRYKLNDLVSFGTKPNGQGFDEWVRQSGTIDFLASDLNDEDIILHAVFPTTLIQTILIPKVLFARGGVDDLLSWDVNMYSGWSVWGGQGGKEWIEPPLADSSCKTIKAGEQILFHRGLHGIRNVESYYELSNKFTQVLDIHYIAERKAWCKLDDHGDIEDIVKVHFLSLGDKKDWGTVISVKYESLAMYCDLTETALARLFDIDRIDYANFTRWGDEGEQVIEDSGVFARKRVLGAVGSYFRGFQLHEMQFSGAIEKEKEYASFIAHDWKNNQVTDISCAPDSIDNYFTQSDKPFEVSPAFFRPEVLLKYKSDSEKYTLGDRNISCRGSWYLETFDINEAGQVHTYLIYLSRLPYEEQLHWKQYNEHPKATISERAKANDFEGKFYDGYYPLQSLKGKLEELDREGVGWWILKSRDLMNSLHSVVTDSQDEWKEEILKLDQIVIEGLVEKKLRSVAKQLGRTPDQKLRSLKLIEECLIGLDYEEGHAKEITAPLHITHDLRNKLKGHVGGETAEQIRRESVEQFGSYSAHFEDLCCRCDEAVGLIANALEERLAAAEAPL